jgi:hypothetical protein
MDLEKYQNVLVITNFGGKIEIRDSNGTVVSPESVIDFMNDIKAEVMRQLNGK